jgi:hypothetical protein
MENPGQFCVEIHKVGVVLRLEGVLSALIGLGQGASGANAKSHPKVAFVGSSSFFGCGGRI